MNDEKPNNEREERKPDGRNEPFERFEEFVKKIAQVPKEELVEERERYEREREKKQAG